MSDTYISEGAALRILRTEGMMSDERARETLRKSHWQSFSGQPYYPMTYVYRRASAARPL